MHERPDRITRRACGYERDGLGQLLTRLQMTGLAQLHVAAGDHFLDVACATGAAVRAAAAEVEIAIGLDSNPAMILQSRLLAASVPVAGFVAGDAHTLPFADETFTAVLCTSALSYFDEPARCIAEMRRVLVAGGRMVLGDLDRTRPGDGRGRRSTRPRRTELLRAATGAGVTPCACTRYLTPFGHYDLISAVCDRPSLSASHPTADGETAGGP